MQAPIVERTQDLLRQRQRTGAELCRLESEPWPCNVFYLGYESGLARDAVAFPAVSGYAVLKGEFHIHAIYSDGR